MLSEITPDIEGQILYDSMYVRYQKKTNSQRKKSGYQGMKGEKNGELFFNRIVQDNEKVFNIDSGDDCKTMCIYKMLLTSESLWNLWKTS